jgi:hypothetical protein
MQLILFLLRYPANHPDIRLSFSQFGDDYFYFVRFPR